MNKEIVKKFDSYPVPIRKKLGTVRSLIFEVAKLNNLGAVEETLKWGEPSYLVKGGSTVRYDWKPKQPDQYAVYFNCKTNLVDTFKEIYGELFNFEGNRAIVFSKKAPLHKPALRHCIKLSLTYHKVKHMPLLGA